MRLRALMLGWPGLVLLGLATGAAGGVVRYERMDRHDALCVSCHHSTADPAELGRPTHSNAFEAPCHDCHALPVRQLAAFTTHRLLGEVPAWVEKVPNPIFGGQTCMECHLARGRGNIDCERCHSTGTTEVPVTERCEACHVGHEVLPPHDAVECRDCHAETYLGRQHRKGIVMSQRLDGVLPEAPGGEGNRGTVPGSHDSEIYR